MVKVDFVPRYRRPRAGLVLYLAKDQPAKAVAVLMVMHLAIALVTYNALVHLAPAKRRRTRAAPRDLDLATRP